MNIVLHLLAFVLYGSAAIFVWLHYWRFYRVPHYIDTPIAHAAHTLWVERVLLGGALVCHGVLVYRYLFPQHIDAMAFGFASTFSAMVWLMGGAYWVESFFLPMTGLGLFLLPVACLASILPLFFPKVFVFYKYPILFKLHFVMANIAYGLLALAALHALLMLYVEYRLHRGKSVKRLLQYSRWLDALPPLLTLEVLLFQFIRIGFVMLTGAVISGLLSSHQVFGRLFTADRKMFFALLSWVMFAALLIGRKYYGWRGRTTLRWVLAAFAAVLLAYVGSRFALEDAFMVSLNYHA